MRKLALYRNTRSGARAWMTDAERTYYSNDWQLVPPPSFTPTWEGWCSPNELRAELQQEQHDSGAKVSKPDNHGH